MSRVDAVSDLPVPTLWRELAATFPFAQFVLTTRAPLRWIDSVERHMKGRELVAEEREFYGRSTLNRRSFLATFERHNDEVEGHFAGRDNLLVMNIEAGDGWEKLCDFLGADVPAGVAFPWESALRSPRGSR